MMKIRNCSLFHFLRVLSLCFLPIYNFKSTFCTLFCSREIENRIRIQSLNKECIQTIFLTSESGKIFRTPCTFSFEEVNCRKMSRYAIRSVSEKLEKSNHQLFLYIYYIQLTNEGLRFPVANAQQRHNSKAYTATPILHSIDKTFPNCEERFI